MIKSSLHREGIQREICKVQRFFFQGMLMLMGKMKRLGGF